jgi:hypothetical protein
MIDQEKMIDQDEVIYHKEKVHMINQHIQAYRNRNPHCVQLVSIIYHVRIHIFIKKKGLCFS